MSTRTRTVLAAVLAVWCAGGCTGDPTNTVRRGDAVLSEGGNGYYFIPRPEAGVTYSWGLPLLTTKSNRRVTLTAIQLLERPPEVRDVSFVRLRYADFNGGVGIIRTPTPASPDPAYKPLPVLGVEYDSVNDDQIVLQFSLGKPIKGRLSGIQIEYVEDGGRRQQDIDAELELGRAA